jgi:hypothetical protein
MAGVKVTDLTSTSTADAADIMYIVDTSSNTSKQIEVQNIYSGMPQFESGSYTPVVSNETDIVNVVVYGGLYSRVGDIVTMSFRLSFELDAAENDGTFNFSLPIATTFTTRYQLMGIAKFNNSTASDNTNYVVEADNTFVTLGIASISSSAAADTFIDCEIMVQYQIL